MFNSDFLFIMLLAFKHTHLISDSDVFLCIFLDFLSFCPPIVFSTTPPCPTSLNIVLYPSHYGSYSPQMVPWPKFQGLAHGLSASFDILPCCERISVGSDSVHFYNSSFSPLFCHWTTFDPTSLIRWRLPTPELNYSQSASWLHWIY